MKAFWLKVVAFIKKVAEFFENQDGGFSSRRLFGGALIVVAAVLAFQKADNAIVLSFLTAGSALLGLTTFDAKLPQ
jgi:hypothetical protein